MNARLLRRLVEARGAHLPWSSLGGDVAAIWSDLDVFEQFGFGIERHPLLGVALRAPAARLCPDQIEEGLAVERLGRRIVVWDRVTSTNDLAARAAASRANDGLVVIAEHQTAGRGRRGRAWSAPPRSCILMSVLLVDAEVQADPAWLTALAAVSVAEVVSEWTGRDARIKWPNDVRVEGRKIAGILVERGAGAVIGIGLNVNNGADELPEDTLGRATSLAILQGGAVDRSELTRDLIVRMDRHDAALRNEGPARLSEAWWERSEYLDRSVQVETCHDTLSGRIARLDLERGVDLEQADGSRRWLAASEVIRIDATWP